MENWYKVKAELKSEILDLAAACSLLPAPCSLLPKFADLDIYS
jgi:hypothetical protein